MSGLSSPLKTSKTNKYPWENMSSTSSPAMTPKMFVPEIVSKAIKKQANTISKIQSGKTRVYFFLKGFSGYNVW